MAYGITPTEGGNKTDEFDILNNPYIEFKLYTFRNNKLVDNHSNDLHLCNSSDLQLIIPEAKPDWYPHSVCVTNRDHVNIS